MSFAPDLAVPPELRLDHGNSDVTRLGKVADDPGVCSVSVQTSVLPTSHRQKVTCVARAHARDLLVHTVVQ